MGIYTVKIWYLHGRLYIFQHASPCLRISTSFGPIKYLNMRGSIDWSMYEIGNFLRRISSRYPICEEGDIRFVTNGNVQIIAFFRRFFTATRWVAVAPKFGDRDELLRKKLHILYIDQSTLPRIFKYLIGVKVVEIRKRGESVLENIFYRVNNKFLPCKYPTP